MSNLKSKAQFCIHLSFFIQNNFRSEGQWEAQSRLSKVKKKKMKIIILSTSLQFTLMHNLRKHKEDEMKKRIWRKKNNAPSKQDKEIKPKVIYIQCTIFETNFTHEKRKSIFEICCIHMAKKTSTTLCWTNHFF